MKNSFLIILVILGCNPSNKIFLDGKEHPIETPPTTVKISENFYADETEISNIDYREYLYWLAQVYGYEAVEYSKALPDTLVWQEKVEYGEPYIGNYFRHPAYDYFPLVGIDLNQAKAFTTWRTERVAELLLTSKGLIKAIKNKSLDNYFTIDRYLSGDYEWILKKESIVLPIYKIPTSGEWEKIAGIENKFKYGTDSLSRYNRKIYRRYKCLYNTKDFEKTPSSNKYYWLKKMPIASRTLSKNTNNLYEIIGNVAELVDNNIVKGGSWRDKLDNISITKNEKFVKPTNWIGFRNICTFRMIKATDH